MDVKQKDSEPDTPQEGQKAYTKYQGRKWVGKLTKIQGFAGKYTAVLMPSEKAPYHDHGGIQVGYDEPIKWDKKAGMWYAPADYD